MKLDILQRAPWSSDFSDCGYHKHVKQLQCSRLPWFSEKNWSMWLEKQIVYKGKGKKVVFHSLEGILVMKNGSCSSGNETLQ